MCHQTALYVPFFNDIALPCAGFILLGYLMIVGMSNAVNLMTAGRMAILPAVKYELRF